MTAVVGILNKTTVALAADSAATVSGPYGDKVYNHAHKLYNLSLYAPVGIMIYSSSELVGLPWETIIKSYRKKLNLKLFLTLSEYASDFIQGLNEYIHYMDKIDIQGQSELHILSVWNKLWSEFNVYLNNTNSVNEFNKSNKEEKNIKLNEVLNNTIIPKFEKAWTHENPLECLKDYEFDSYKKESEDYLKETLLDKFAEIEFTATEETLNKIIHLGFIEITNRIEEGSWTGIVIAGFGEKELFPSLEACRVGPLVNGKIRIDKDKPTIISSNKSSAVKPYAQTHDMYSFLTGIDPEIRAAVRSGADNAFEDFIDSVCEKTNDEGGRKAIKNLLSEYKGPTLDKLMLALSEVSQELHIDPILVSASLSSKEELAEMAESLISLTSLKRKFSLSTESVGGPIDVAVITKGEGFIWLKRKQYFKPEINLNYLGNVLNKLPHNSPSNPLDHEPLDA